ncbi:MAG TPA: hypothetical protein VEM76_10035, partial [Anaeromyxobacteraceae bacterium]|nr:hypothetical protein [Anaeromyxobacteraceae bacterium]
MKGSSSDRGLLFAAIAMTVGTLAVAGLAAAGALRPNATAHPLTPALSPAGGEGGRSALLTS